MSRAIPPEVDLSLPDLELELVEDISPIAPPGFLRLIRRRLRLRSADGKRSEPFVYDEIDRRAIDAVVIAAHYVAPAPGAQGAQRWVYLRSALRPPLRFRDPARSPGGARETGGLWELPAGLIEPGEQSTGGILRAGCRELREELGFLALETDFQWLGPPTWPAPGIISERLFFVHLEVKPERRGEPSLDGSALERDGRVIAVPLEHALHLCRTGRIEDAKTELGLRRLAENLPSVAPGLSPDARSNE
ncbi:MAG TPA: NUDIX domain-containing protein [Polyangiaceae bacterium]|jgi:ADP-ribose pyrophosphatase|nr:NUDIX domain-containing protein [Polyangiaceae bacterium]